MTNIGRAAVQTTRLGERWGAQMRAIGTTLRYAFAGTVVFGAVRFLQTLRETQRQFALIGAIGGFDEAARSAAEADQRLNQLYTNAQRGAISAITPVGDFNQGLINLYSTIQDLDANVAVKMTTEISKGAQLAQVSTEDLTRAVAGMSQAFGTAQNVPNFQRYVRGFYALTAEAPGGIAYGPQFIQQLAPLSAVARFANIDPAQMIGLYLTTLRTGGTPATAGRGLQYLLQSISVPASTEAAKALKQAGVTPDVVQQRGGVAAMQMLIEEARRRGLTKQQEKRIAGLSGEQIDMLEALAPEQVGPALGISGQGLAFLSEAIGRIHGIRALVAIMAQQKGPRGNQMLKDIETARMWMDDTEEAHRRFAKKWEEFARRQPLQGAAVAIDVIQRQVMQAVAPLTSLAARGITRAGAAAISDPSRTQLGAQIGLGGLAAYGLGRFLIPGLRRGPGLGRGLVGLGAAEAAISQGAQGPGLSPQNPLYVIVVGQIFGGGASTAAATAAGTAGGAAGGRLTRAGRWGLRGTVAGGLAWLAASQLPWWQQGKDEPGLGGFKRDIAGARGLLGRIPGPSGLDLIGSLFGAEAAEAATGRKREPIRVEGQAQIVLDLNIRDRQGQLRRRRVHVPVDLWSGGRTPGSRGKKANTNRSSRDTRPG